MLVERYHIDPQAKVVYTQLCSLLAQAAHFNAISIMQDYDGNCVIHYAAQLGCVEIVKVLVERHGVDPGTLTKVGCMC